MSLSQKHDVLYGSQCCLSGEGVAGVVLMNHAESRHLAFKHRRKKEECLIIKTLEIFPLFVKTADFNKSV